jgi:hypothetical protein
MKIIRETLNKIECEYFRHNELESKITLFINEQGQSPLIEKIKLYDESKDILVALSEQEGLAVQAFLMSAFTENGELSRNFHSDFAPLKIRSGDEFTLTLQYSNYGDPYASGISFSLDSESGEDDFFGFIEHSKLYYACINSIVISAQ